MWEGRFKSQALLDEQALLSCMAYVDLNPIRAKMTKTPETSNHTSIQQRITSAKQGKQPNTLQAFVGNPRHNMPKGIAFSLKDYCELVDITGRSIREDKAGHIDQQQSPILERLGLNSDQWLNTEIQADIARYRLAGATDSEIRIAFTNAISTTRN